MMRKRRSIEMMVERLFFECLSCIYVLGGACIEKVLYSF